MVDIDMTKTAKIVIAGGTGFIGQYLVKRFLNDQHHVTVIGRNAAKITALCGNQVEAVTWDALTQAGAETLRGMDVVINLVGDNIGAKRWSPKRKQVLLESRVRATETLSQLCAELAEQAPALFNAGGVGYYGLQAGEPYGLPEAFTEKSTEELRHRTDFLGQISLAWENATEAARQNHVRVVIMRFGVVLGDGGVLKKLAIPFKLGLGGPIGSGLQPFAWIAIEDVYRAICFLLDHQTIEGPVNFVSPHGINQKTFAKAFAAKLNRPCLLPTPAFALQLLYGQMADELLLNGQHVKPGVLTSHGFEFHSEALTDGLMFKDGE